MKIINFEKIKEYVITVGLGIILISSLINIINQLFTIIKAKNDNNTLSTQVEKLENEKIGLKEKIKIASESAFVEEQKRELLGMGSKDDYWIVEPRNIDTSNIYPKAQIGDEKSNISKWIGLFTD